MQAKSILPLIDLVFLTLGSLLGIMSHMERVTALPIELAQVGRGAAIVKHGHFSVVTLTEEGVTVDGDPVAPGELGDRVWRKDVVLRPAKTVQTGRTQQVLADLVRAGARVSLEVSEENPKKNGR